MAKKWISEAREEMQEHGTVGKFGKATAKKISAGIKAGGKQEKRAVFAKNMKAIAAKHDRGK